MNTMPEDDSVEIDRRSFLKFVGLGASAASLTHALGPLYSAQAASGPTAAIAPAATDPGAWVEANGSPNWVPVDYPVPLPHDRRDIRDAVRLATFEVRDELLVPKGFRTDVMIQWGDKLGPVNRQISFGFNADYTGLVPIEGKTDEYYLIVNHEYVSPRTWLAGFEEAHGQKLPRIRLVADPDKARYPDGRLEVDGDLLETHRIDLQDEAVCASLKPATLAAIRLMCQAALADMGISIVHVKRDAAGRFEVVRNAPDHQRYTGIDRPIGTISNCSGETTPWGTFLSCEENFQDQITEWIAPDGSPLGDVRMQFKGVAAHPSIGLPFEFEGLGQGCEPPLDGREFGWVVEVDPAKGTIRKHKTLGRFRHENVALRVEKGKKLVAYQGDDRRGGHVYKFVSDEIVRNPAAKTNSRLLRKGTLYVSQWNEDFTGKWVPVSPDSPVVMPQPKHCSTGHQWLPDRGHVGSLPLNGVIRMKPMGGHVAVSDGGFEGRRVTPSEWAAGIEKFAGKPFAQATLADLVRAPQGRKLTPEKLREHQEWVIQLDAYAMANAAGGTPLSRPEDIEVHPHDKSVYIAFTDSTGSGDGSPDSRIFPHSRGKNSLQYGAIYRLVEDDNDPAALTFKWGRFITSGEVADADAGKDRVGGFACADNLAFDPQGNMWVVTDISTPSHNHPVTREHATTQPGGSRFVGIFGNNALFMIPTRGPKAGIPHCFAIGPMECELTGPTFTRDGKTLIIAVQHPGELNGARGRYSGIPTEEQRTMTIMDRDGKLFEQKRIVPLGSNYPSKQLGTVPKPCVVCITRTE